MCAHFQPVRCRGLIGKLRQPARAAFMLKRQCAGTRAEQMLCDRIRVIGCERAEQPVKYTRILLLDSHLREIHPRAYDVLPKILAPDLPMHRIGHHADHQHARQANRQRLLACRFAPVGQCPGAIEGFELE